MKKITAIITMIMISAFAFSQVETGKAKSTIMGKGKLVASPVSELLIDHFHLNFNLYKFEEDQGGSNNVALSSKVGVRARLGNVDEALVQEITNEAFAYFVESWKKRNITITMADKAVMEKSKVYAKASKKGKASMINGGVSNNQEKKSHTMQAWPEGVDIASSGEGPLATYGNAKHMWQYGIGNSASFNATIDFISFKTAKLGSTASVKSNPRLTMTGGLVSTIWEKNKVGGYIGSIATDGTEDYYSEAVDESMEALGSKVVDRVYKADRAKYKANVLEMIQKSMDASFADYDEVVAKNSK
ncbi:MAG: hypothetical protein RIM99_04730 [Cyclobacteriaceae bacterium]